MIESVDIAIAGGGPGGLAAAAAAANAGVSVAVFEKNSEIGSPTRTSGGTFISDLEALGIPREMYHPVYACRFLSPKREARWEYKDAVACGIDVRRTYQFLAESAIAAGARIFPATPVMGVRQNEAGVVGLTVKDRRGREHRVASRVAIDASGYRAQLLREAGVTNGHERFGVGAEYDLYAPNYDEREVVLLVGSMVAPCGYGWALPYGRHRVRLGVGVIHADTDAKPEDYLERLLEKAGDFGMDLRGAQPVEFHTGLIPSDGLAQRFTGNGIVGVGDSAGQPSALLGEGIRWAMWAGAMAGKTAAEAVKANNTSAAFLKRYEERWRAAHGTNLRIAAEINRRIAGWTDERWDAGTEALGKLTAEQFIQALRSELVGTWLFQAAWANPSLLKAGARELLRRAGVPGVGAFR